MYKGKKILIVCALLVIILPLLMPLLMHVYNELTTMYIETQVVLILNSCEIEVLECNRYHGKLSGNGNGTHYCCVFLIKGSPEETMTLLKEKLKYSIWHKKASDDGVFYSPSLEHRNIEFDNNEFRRNPGDFIALFVYYEPKSDLLPSIDLCAH